MATAETNIDKDVDDDEDESEESGRNPSAQASPDAAPAFQSRASFVGNVWTICSREVRAYFDSLVAYVVIGLSMAAVGVYFFLVENGFWQVDRASMARMFDTQAKQPLSLPWMLAFLVIPLVTMRSIAEEKRSGTLELLITMPVRDPEVILGKYFAAVLMVLILFACSLLYPVAMFVWPWHLGALDWGPVLSSYLGLTLFAMAGVGVGIMFSSLTESQIIAFFLTAFTMGALMLVGSASEAVGGWLGDSLAFISFQTRFAPFSRGLIDTRAVIYFLSIAIITLLVAFRSLESRKWK